MGRLWARGLFGPEAIKFLQMHSLSVASEEVDSKQRVVSFNCTISGDWRLICSVIKFVDKSFINFNDKPKVFKVEDRRYVCFYRYGLRDKVVNNYVYQSAIIPEVLCRSESLKCVALNHPQRIVCMYLGMCVYASNIKQVRREIV